MTDTFPELPDFLNRRLSPLASATMEERRELLKAQATANALDLALSGVWADAERDAIKERFALRKQESRELRKQEKRMAENGVRILLNQKIENCPLLPGTHTVELVHHGRKWVRFRCIGREKCVKVRRVIWDAVREA